MTLITLWGRLLIISGIKLWQHSLPIGGIINLSTYINKKIWDKESLSYLEILKQSPNKMDGITTHTVKSTQEH